MKGISIGALILLFAVIGCGGGNKVAQKENGSSEGASASLSGEVIIDGSSTVLPISEAMSEEFTAQHPNVRVPVAASGTGGGFKKFASKEVDISDASRPIKQSEEKACAANGVEFIELPIAFDGLTVAVNLQNDWVDHLTVAELKAIWEPGSKVRYWSDVRPNWPKIEIKLYGAGHDSGTFDYFTEAVMGSEGSIRSDYTGSEDDNTLVQGVAGDKGSLGFFGFNYYVENKDKIRAVPIDAGRGPITPSEETIRTGEYSPLSRPLFIYVRKDAADRPEVDAFVNFYVSNAAEIVPETGYVPLTAEIYKLVAERFKKRVSGSVFSGGSQIGVRIDQILAKESGSR